MNRFNKNQEWEFITQETNANKPSKPIYGKELRRRELLLTLSQVLVDYSKEAKRSRKEFQKAVYNKIKNFYLNWH